MTHWLGLGLSFCLFIYLCLCCVKVNTTWTFPSQTLGWLTQKRSVVQTQLSFSPTQILLSPTQILLLQLPHHTVPWPLLLQPKVSIRWGNTDQDFQCGMSIPNCATSEDLPTSQKAPPRPRCRCKMETAQAGMSFYL